MILAVVGDLASVAADAVVRPANTWLEPLTPALRRLDAAAGPKFVERCRLRHELPPGAAVVTGAGDLLAEFMVHLVLGAAEGDVTPDTLRRAMDAGLWQCTQWQISALATPVPSAGDVAPAAALAILLEVARGHMRNADHPATLLIVTANDTERAMVSAHIGEESA